MATKKAGDFGNSVSSGIDQQAGDRTGGTSATLPLPGLWKGCAQSFPPTSRQIVEPQVSQVLALFGNIRDPSPNFCSEHLPMESLEAVRL